MELSEPLVEAYWPADDSQPLLDLTVGALLARTASAHPDRLALVDGQSDPAARRQWTYRELDGLADTVARALLERFDPGDRLAIDRRLGRAVAGFQNSAKPVIAQVHGHCVGIGRYLVEVSDLAICADTTRFSHAEQRLGLAGNTFHLPTLIVAYGPKKAREILLFGDQFDGPTALEMGLVNRSVPESELEAAVEAFVEKVARNAKDALVMGKAAHNMALASLGMNSYIHAGMVGHALGTNIKFDEGEFQLLPDPARRRHERGLPKSGCLPRHQLRTTAPG